MDHLIDPRLRKLIDTLDLPELAQVRSLVHLRTMFLEQQRADERRRAEEVEAARARRLPRGRPKRSDVDRATLVAALARNDGVVRAAAREIGLPRNTFARHAREIPAWAWQYGPEIVEEHARILHESAVAPGVARSREYQSVRSTKASGLLVPIWNVRGQRVWSQLRVDQPRDRRHRYENGRDAHPVVDCSPAARLLVLDRARPLHVTEAPRKADAAVSLGLAAVAFPGVRMMHLDDETWGFIGVRERDVRIVFDADAAVKPDVAACEWHLAAYLSRLGARVRVLRLPWRQGLDDFLAAGGDVESLPSAALAATAPAFPGWPAVRRKRRSRGA